MAVGGGGAVPSSLLPPSPHCCVHPEFALDTAAGPASSCCFKLPTVTGSLREAQGEGSLFYTAIDHKP